MPWGERQVKERDCKRLTVGLEETLLHTRQSQVRTKMGRHPQSPPCQSMGRTLVPPSSHYIFLGTSPQPGLPAAQPDPMCGKASSFLVMDQLSSINPRPSGLLSSYLTAVSFRDFHQTSCNLSLHFIPITLKRGTYSVSSILKLWMARNLETSSLLLGSSSFNP